jgi:hypothetical protein
VVRCVLPFLGAHAVLTVGVRFLTAWRATPTITGISNMLATVIGLNTLLDEVLDVAVLDVAVLCMGEVRLADVLDFTLPAD